MLTDRADFLIVGSTPQALLLAGLLADGHGKSVLLQGESQAGRRLRWGLDLSVGALTRPESWALLAETVPETHRLIIRIGKRAALARLDPVLVAAEAPGQQALRHIRHMAVGFGLAAEPAPAALLGPGRDGLLLRDAALLVRPVLEPALERWLDGMGVRRLSPLTEVQMAGDGSAQVMLDDRAITVGQTILADDDAIIAHLHEAAWPALLQRQVASVILTRAVAPLAAPLLLDLDAGLVLAQQSEGGVLAQGPGEIAALAARLMPHLGRTGAYEQAGQSQATRLVTSDGAPALGRVGGTGPDILAGFGPVGAFLAPALARWLCGTASARENAWCGARLVTRDASSGLVCDIGEG